jgi:hypothetical protein
MKLNNLLKNIKNIGLALSLLVGFLLIAGTNVHAQYQGRQNDRNNNDRYDNNGGKMYRFAVQKGYEDGLKKGLKEARSHRNSNAENDSVYKIASRGYQGRHGNKSDFQIAYREGFVRGYNEAFQRYQNDDRNKWDRNRRSRNNN